MRLILDCDEVSVRPYSTGRVRVTIEEPDEADFKGESAALLEIIGREAAIKYFQIEEATDVD